MQAQIKNESALGLVIVQGNSETTTTTVKQLNTYKREKNLFTAKGSYTKTESTDVVTAKSWDALLRYDRDLMPKVSVYGSYDVESNRFSGFAIRNTAELGASYKFYDTEALSWSVDLAYSYRETDIVGQAALETSPGAVFGTRFERKVTDGLTYDLWAKYRHDFSDYENHTLSVEPGLAIVMTEIFSLKLSYVLKSQARIQPPATEHTDTTFTTSLVAKF